LSTACVLPAKDWQALAATVTTKLSGVQVENTWPLVDTPAPQPRLHGDNSWTEVLDMTLHGWSLSDVLVIFEEHDPFFRDWHDSMADTCAAPLAQFAQ
jgi:hypothetical protein